MSELPSVEPPKLVRCALPYSFNVSNLNFTFTIPKYLKYRNQGKDHNSETKQYFIWFLKYISNNKGYMLWDPTIQ